MTSSPDLRAQLANAVAQSRDSSDIETDFLPGKREEFRRLMADSINDIMADPDDSDSGVIAPELFSSMAMLIHATGQDRETQAFVVDQLNNLLKKKLPDAVTLFAETLLEESREAGCPQVEFVVSHFLDQLEPGPASIKYVSHDLI
jgi:hypothetical protein